MYMYIIAHYARKKRKRNNKQFTCTMYIHVHAHTELHVHVHVHVHVYVHVLVYILTLHVHVHTYLGGVVRGHKVQRGFLGGAAGQHSGGAILDEEGGGEGVSPHDGQVEETVALCVHTVQVTLVAHQRGGDALMAV